MKALLLADITHPTAAVYDHIQAITKHSTHEWTILNPLSCRVLHKIDLDHFDAIGFHYSIRPHNPYYVPKALYKKIKAYQGKKFQFIQDEYSQVRLTMDTMADLGISLMYTLVRPSLVRDAYPDPRLKDTEFVTVLTGYIPEGLQTVDTPRISERTTDIFYRSRACSYWLGKLAQEKILIAEGVESRCQGKNLKIDVSVLEEDRIYGQEWVRRLSDTRAVLGTESGASIWDFTGEIEKNTRKFLQKNPYASFEEVEEKLLHPFEGNVLYTAISPRVFEAAALKTPMIMFPGWYSGVCEPHLHYIPLEKDFSNLDEVIEKLKDTEYMQDMADRTYQDLILSGKYVESVLAKTVDDTLKPITQFSPKHAMESIQSHVQNQIKKYRVLQYLHWIRMEFVFASSNFFRILFDSSTPWKYKAQKLTLGAQRYFLYLKPRLLLLFKSS